jgi:hypothetical protein
MEIVQVYSDHGRSGLNIAGRDGLNQLMADVEAKRTLVPSRVTRWAELYLTQPEGFQTPSRILAGVKRVHLTPGQSIHIGFTIDQRSLGQVDAKGNRVILPGE